MPLIKVTDGGTAEDWHPRYQLLTQTRARLVFHSRKTSDLAEFFARSGHRVHNQHGLEIYAYCGRYSKLPVVGRTEMYDSMNLRHNGWMGGVLKQASVDLPMPDVVQTMIDGALPNMLATSRYFVGFQMFDVQGITNLAGPKVARRMTNQPKLLHDQGVTKLLMQGRELSFSELSEALEAHGWSGATVDLP